jgi:hypothetical protein
MLCPLLSQQPRICLKCPLPQRGKNVPMLKLSTVPWKHMQESTAPAFNLNNCLKHWSFSNFTPSNRATCKIRQYGPTGSLNPELKRRRKPFPPPWTDTQLQKCSILSLAILTQVLLQPHYYWSKSYQYLFDISAPSGNKTTPIQRTVSNLTDKAIPARISLHIVENKNKNLQWWQVIPGHSPKYSLNSMQYFKIYVSLWMNLRVKHWAPASSHNGSATLVPQLSR